MKAAQNLAGQSYGEMENAFKYRKTLVNGCACRPMPWSTAERSRHRQYAYLDAVKRSYALAEARAEKRREEAAAKAAKEHEENLRKINAALQTQPEGTELARPETYFDRELRNDKQTQQRWIEVSQRYAAPYLIYVLRRQKIDTKTLNNVARTNLASQSNLIRVGSGFAIASSNQFNGASFAKSERSTKHLRPSTRATSRKRSRRERIRKRKKKKSKVAFSGMFAKNKSKYRWPGD